VTVIAVLGAGRMGTAICTPLLDRGHEVRLVGTHLDVEFIQALRSNGVHPGLGHPLPPGATFHQFEDAEAAFEGAERVVIGVSSAGIAWAGQALARLLTVPLPLIVVTKGLEWDGSRFRLLPDVLFDHLPEPLHTGQRPVAVTGPCIAGELVRQRDTCVTFTARNEDDARAWADLAGTTYYRVWTSTDFAGCEASAALKNAFAVGVGFASGQLERTRGRSAAPDPPGIEAHNVEAPVFAQAVAEMSELAGLVGGDPATPLGLVGVGDLLVTLHARSVRLGRTLGRGLTYEEAVREMPGVTLEGAATIGVVGRALEVLDATGRTTPDRLPLMRHMVSVIDGAPVQIPFERFFGGLPEGSGG
jgi:glycerol-3-phosphate dehydrogenase (NAD(P)+)